MASRRIIFRRKGGRFAKAIDRYKDDIVDSVQVKRRGKWVTVASDIIETGGLEPERLAFVVNRDEFESMPDALQFFKEYTSNKKYKAWDIAEQIDQTKGIRRKLIKITMNLVSGKTMQKVHFYHELTSNQKRSYHLFKRINDEMKFESVFLYDRIGKKRLEDRRGRKMNLKSVTVEMVL